MYAVQILSEEEAVEKSQILDKSKETYRLVSPNLFISNIIL